MFLPVLVTLALAAAVGTAVVVQNQEQTDRVAAADRAADRFLSEVGAFHVSVVDAINESHTGDPGDMVDVLDTAMAKPPVLGEAPADGIERSATYADALGVQKDFLKPYQDLRRELRRADVALDFIKACRDALALQTSDYVGYGVLTSSEPVRERMIPAFVREREEFKKVRVPRGEAKIAGAVLAALQYVIDEATVLADKIDADGTYFLSYAERFSSVAVEVDDYATRVKGDVVEAINALADAA